jgi:hypothetical protein
LKVGSAGSGASGVEFGESALNGERGAHRALGVVLLRVRIAEQGHKTVAELFQHIAAKSSHRLRSLIEIGPDEIAPILRVELGREARRVDEVAEHHGDRAALGGRRVRRMSVGGPILSRPSVAQQGRRSP